MKNFNWKQWANVVLGLLVIAFAYTGAHVTRFVVVGVLVVVLALWSAFEKK
ncbi:MAG: hypothetical protein M1153_01305 [Patescibacteria group bacterium]|nr:hypothetical protein [Patescibacteria group bacterium]